MENSGMRKVLSPKNDGHLFLDGKRIMDFALEEVKEGIESFLKAVGCEKEEVALFACHQANKRILDFLSDMLQVPREKVPFTSAEIGNESSASIPLVLTQMNGKADLSKVLCVGFGVGLSVGLCLADFSCTKCYGVAEL